MTVSEAAIDGGARRVEGLNGPANSELHDADVQHKLSRRRRRRGGSELDHGARRQLFHDRQRDMDIGARPNREVTHGFSVAKDQDIHEVVRRVAGAEVDDLSAFAVGHGIG